MRPSKETQRLAQRKEQERALLCLLWHSSCPRRAEWLPPRGPQSAERHASGPAAGNACTGPACLRRRRRPARLAGLNLRLQIGNLQNWRATCERVYDDAFAAGEPAARGFFCSRVAPVQQRGGARCCGAGLVPAGKTVPQVVSGGPQAGGERAALRSSRPAGKWVGNWASWRRARRAATSPAGEAALTAPCGQDLRATWRAGRAARAHVTPAESECYTLSSASPVARGPHLAIGAAVGPRRRGPSCKSGGGFKTFGAPFFFSRLCRPDTLLRAAQTHAQTHRRTDAQRVAQTDQRGARVYLVRCC